MIFAILCAIVALTRHRVASETLALAAVPGTHAETVPQAKILLEKRTCLRIIQRRLRHVAARSRVSIPLAERTGLLATERLDKLWTIHAVSNSAGGRVGHPHATVVRLQVACGSIGDVGAHVATGFLSISIVDPGAVVPVPKARADAIVIGTCHFGSLPAFVFVVAPRAGKGRLSIATSLVVVHAQT